MREQQLELRAARPREFIRRQVLRLLQLSQNGEERRGR